MVYQQYLPPPGLRYHVRYFWSFEGTLKDVKRLHIQSFADQYPRLIFQSLHHYESLETLEGGRLPVCYLSGVDTGRTDALMGGQFSHFGVSFYPHALPAFFGISSDQLTNQMPDLTIVSNTTLPRKLNLATSHEERVKITTHWLLEQLKHSRSNDMLMLDLMDRFGNDTSVGVHTLSKRYKLSERQLERRFKAGVGVSHRKYQCILRFQRSLKLLQHKTYSELTALAYELGYADQSHFIREFNGFAGVTPYQFIKNRNVGSESASFIYVHGHP